MRIDFYIEIDGAETQITSFYDMTSNPFNLGDVVNLNVSELYPIDYNKFKPDFKIKMIEDNNKLQDLYSRTKVKLISESKWVDFRVAKAPSLVIEYQCEFIKKD